jgi:hypothetical protein
VLQKLQLNEILGKELAWLNTLKSEKARKINRDKPSFISHTEETLTNISLQCRTESNERITNISSSSSPQLETLELSKISDTISNLPALSEKLNSTLINIRKIRDRNTCEVAEHQRETAKRKTPTKNKKRKRKGGVTSSSSESIEVKSDVGVDDLRKKTRMKEIMKQCVKTANTEHSLISVKTLPGAQADEKRKQLDSLKQRFSFISEPHKKKAGTVHDTHAFTTVKDVMDEASYDQQTQLSAKLSPNTVQKLQQFKRSDSDLHLSQNIPEDKESLIPVAEVVNSRKDSNIYSVTKQFEACSDLVNCEKKSNSQQSSSSGLSNDGSVSLNRNVSKLSLNVPQVFSTGGDDLEDLDFDI